MSSSVVNGGLQTQKGRGASNTPASLLEEGLMNKKEISAQFFRSLQRYFSTHWEHEISESDGCTSPIESLFYSAMNAVALLSDDVGISVCLDHQFPVGKYRADFLVTLMKSNVYDIQGQGMYFDAKVIVECDGHDFHEKTKQQASKDKKRDREIQAAGFHILRFSGSDIWNDVFCCAQEVYDFLLADINSQIVSLR